MTGSTGLPGMPARVMRLVRSPTLGEARANDLRRAAAWLCITLALSVAGAGHADPVLEDEVLAARPGATTAASAGPAGVTAPPDAVMDLPASTAAPSSGAMPPSAGSAPAASPISYSGLRRLLEDGDGGTGTFDYTALPQDLDDDARWEPESGRRERGMSATISVAAGTGGMLQTSASVTIPLLDDRMTIRVSGSKGRGDGYIRDFSGDGLFGGGSRGDYSARDLDRSRLGVDLRWSPEAAGRLGGRFEQPDTRASRRRP